MPTINQSDLQVKQFVALPEQVAQFPLHGRHEVSAKYLPFGQLRHWEEDDPVQVAQDPSQSKQIPLFGGFIYMFVLAHGQGFEERGAVPTAQRLVEGTSTVTNSILISRKPIDSLQESSSAQLMIFNSRLVREECG